MEKPYRYLKKLVKIHNSFYVVAPKDWMKLQAKKLKIKNVVNVIVEIYKDKIVITPSK
ncbi:unnamed protein product [marine sediment metagenome]|uniref:SpoVT-AbrB domain-containing protein n=1 Tax=marine sediment metagenome TaxID=412755 RepID=X1H4P4_9ZZZZ